MNKIKIIPIAISIVGIMFIVPIILLRIFNLSEELAGVIFGEIALFVCLIVIFYIFRRVDNETMEDRRLYLNESEN